MCVRLKKMNLKTEDMSGTWKMPKQLQKQINENNGNFELIVKCGKCEECQQERTNNWKYKIHLEAIEAKEKCFITLTYRNNNQKQLNKKHLQDFIKRLRHETTNKIKYFGAGEYGTLKGRPHYHIIIINYQPKDLKQIYGNKSKSNKTMYLSKRINEIWGHGITTIQQFNIAEVGYIMNYTTIKTNQDKLYNQKQIEKRKKELQKLHYKYIHNREWKSLKNAPQEIQKAYRHEYETKVKTIKDKWQTEFNIASKGLGFDNYIKKEYWKYDLILDNFKYQRPKEYLRKILEKPDQFDNEIIKYNLNEILSRQKWATENYEDKINNQEQEEKKATLKNNKREKKLKENLFF